MIEKESLENGLVLNVSWLTVQLEVLDCVFGSFATGLSLSLSLSLPLQLLQSSSVFFLEWRQRKWAICWTWRGISERTLKEEEEAEAEAQQEAEAERKNNKTKYQVLKKEGNVPLKRFLAVELVSSGQLNRFTCCQQIKKNQIKWSNISENNSIALDPRPFSPLFLSFSPFSAFLCIHFLSLSTSSLDLWR